MPDFDRSYFNHIRCDLGASLNYADPDHVCEFDRKDLFDLFDECGVVPMQSEYIFGV